MFLEKLSEFADQIDLPPPMYQSTPVRYVILLGADGKYKGIDEFTDGKNRASISFVAPHCKRASNIRPKLLVDNGEYTLGIAREKSDPRRVQEQHTAYVAQVQECAVATHEPTVLAVARFLASSDIVQVAKEKGEFDPSSNITFKVEGLYPFDQATVRNYWAKKAAASDSEILMQCLVCGEMRPPVERLPIVIKGIPGGQSTGLTLISANAAAFESYGLSASLIAPTCEGCGERFGNALNKLLRQKETRIIIPPLAYIFWVRHAKEPEHGTEDLNMADLMDADPDAVGELFRATRSGNAASTYLDTAEFYAATLSASGARVVLRDWLETSLGAVQDNLRRYFRLQEIRGGSDELLRFSLYQLINTTINQHSKEKPVAQSPVIGSPICYCAINQHSKEKPVAQVGEALMHVALHGGQLPISLMHRVVRRIRANRDVQAAQAALIKMVLLSQPRYDTLITDQERGHDMTTVHEECTDTAYLCGRLLAQLDYIQYKALGKINATIIDRFYGTASTAPAVVFPRLIRGAQPHLATIRQKRNQQSKGYMDYLDKELAELLTDLPSFPPILSLEKQGMFALGFYHQKAKFLSQWQSNARDKEPSETLDNTEEQTEITSDSEEESRLCQL